MVGSAHTRGYGGERREEKGGEEGLSAGLLQDVSSR